MRHFATVVALFTILFLASDAIRAENRLLIGGWSKHLSSKGATNENHKVVGIETHGWAAGYFENSFGRDSFFVNKAWRWSGILGVEHLEAMAGVGVSYGYRKCWGDDGDRAIVCPDGVIGLAWTQWRLVPSIKLKGDALVFSPEIKF